MQKYAIFTEDSFYLVNLLGDTAACALAVCTPGTLAVMRADGNKIPRNIAVPSSHEIAVKSLLLEHCQQSINDQRISCPETIYQTDRVVENAADFIWGVCNIVGYHEEGEA
jgi:hypothetical protein